MLGKKLKSLRLENNYSMQDFCDKFNSMYNTNINKSMVSKWENGIMEPVLDNARQICKFYNISLDYLLDLDYKSQTAQEITEKLTILEEEDLEEILKFINFKIHTKVKSTH